VSAKKIVSTAKPTAVDAPLAKSKSLRHTRRPSRNGLEPCRSFVEAVRAAFNFLLAEHGFSAPKLDVSPPECSVRYDKGDALGVDVTREYLGAPWVVVRGGEPSMRFGLHELEALLDPRHRERAPELPSAPDDVQTAAILEHFASFLRAHADAIFGGDPSVFSQLRARRGSDLA
jgi:hypothetical protein